jgi:hypothetical protein
MNYDITLYALNNSAFDTIIRLLIESAEGSDYKVKTYAGKVLSPMSSIAFSLYLEGSSNPEAFKLSLDVDDVAETGMDAVYISPSRIGLGIERGKHHWGIAGTLFRVVPDLSPAYITSYLLDKKMNREMALFKQYSSLALSPELEQAIEAERKRVKA